MTAPNFPHKFRECFLKHSNNKEYLNQYLAENLHQIILAQKTNYRLRKRHPNYCFIIAT